MFLWADGNPLVPGPSYIDSGDTAWQLTAATLVGLMSLPGLAVLYGGLVPKKWAVNTMLMAFAGFSLVLVAWVLWVFKEGFGTAWIKNFVGEPGPVLRPGNELGKAFIPSLPDTGSSGTLLPTFRFPLSTLVYFQFVFAAITPLLFLGSVLGRMNFRAWVVFVPLWSTFAYGVNAFLLWGGGYWAQHGALDYSGGYVIHLAAGTTGFVAAAIIGPRLKRDRDHFAPNNLMMVAIGAGLLWLGWNGFNGGDPYFASADASAAVLNTNLAAGVALLTWMFLDMFVGKQKKPTLLGAINGMICGLVAITPAAGYVSGWGAIFEGVVPCAIVWVAWNYLARIRPFNRVDDVMGVVYTHGIAGLTGGLVVGLVADPNMITYVTAASPNTPSMLYSGLFYGGHSWHLFKVQAGAALTVIIWDALVTTVLLLLIRYVLRLRLRLPDAVLAVGDLDIHEEEVQPSETLTALRGSEAEPPGPALRPPTGDVATSEPAQTKEAPSG